jgi:hypothetical protein
MGARFSKLIVTLMTLGIFLAGIGFTATAEAASGVPYVDKGAVGAIGLCDQHGNPMTHGNIDTKPFVWKAVDETAAKAPYNVSGSSATLYAYQPREGTAPSEWFGTQISYSSAFTTPLHPTAALTGVDESLSSYLTAYPVEWDGLVELRMYLRAAGYPADTTNYDATNIRVKGNTWTVVGGDPVSCIDGSGVSDAVALAQNSAAVASLSAQTTVVASPAAKGASAQSAGGSVGSSSHSHLLVWVTIAVLVVVTGAGSIRWSRRRS